MNLCIGASVRQVPWRTSFLTSRTHGDVGVTHFLTANKSTSAKRFICIQNQFNRLYNYFQIQIRKSIMSHENHYSILISMVTDFQQAPVGSSLTEVGAWTAQTLVMELVFCTLNCHLSERERAGPLLEVERYWLVPPHPALALKPVPREGLDSTILKWFTVRQQASLGLLVSPQLPLCSHLRQPSAVSWTLW